VPGWAAGALRQIQDTDAVAPWVLAQLPNYHAQDRRQYASLLRSRDAFDARAGLLTQAAARPTTNCATSPRTIERSSLRCSASPVPTCPPPTTDCPAPWPTRTPLVQHGISRDTDMTEPRRTTGTGDERRDPWGTVEAARPRCTVVRVL